jgi:hypothetical protein
MISKEYQVGNIVNGISCLLIGFVIYFIFSPNVLMFRYFNLGETKAIVDKNYNIVFSLIRNYLCDIVWCVFVFETVLFLIIQKTPLFYVLFLAMVPFIAELSQYYRLIPGTYDIVDLLLYIIILIAYFSKFKIKYKNENDIN